jgi:hypothetical protein
MIKLELLVRKAAWHAVRTGIAAYNVFGVMLRLDCAGFKCAWIRAALLSQWLGRCGYA